MENNSGEKKEKRGSKKIVSLVLFIIIFCAIVYIGWSSCSDWYKERQQWVKMGFAEDKFPYKMLGERELVEKGLWSGESPALNAVPTRTTPEETYAKFRQALIDGDIDKAVECFTKEKQDEYRDALTKAKDEGRFTGIIDKLKDITPEGKEITNKSTGSSSTSYEFFYKENQNDTYTTSHTIVFYKNWDGDWLMDNL